MSKTKFMWGFETERFKRMDSKLAAVLILVALLPVFVIGILSIMDAERSLRDQSIRQLAAVADAKVERLETYLSERKADAIVLSQSPSLLSELGQLSNIFRRQGIRSSEYVTAAARTRAYLNRFLKTSDCYQNLLLADLDGNIIFSLEESLETGTNLRTGPHRGGSLAKAFDKISTLLTTVTTDCESGDPIHIHEKNSKAHEHQRAFVATPILKQGLLVGMVAFEINNQEIFKIVQDYSGLGNTGDVVVSRLEGDHILFMAPSRHDHEAAFHRQIPLNSRLGIQLQEAVNGKKSISQSLDYRGEEILSASRYLPTFRWGMSVNMDVAEAFASVRTLRNRSVSVAIAVTVFVALMAPLISRFLSGPIRALAQTQRDFGRGDLTRRAIVFSKDEVGDLALSFNEMTNTIQQQLERLLGAQTQLERTNTSLRTSGEKFRQLADNIADVFWITSADRHQMHYINAAYERIWGRSAESLYANPHQWMEAIVPDDRERVIAAFMSPENHKTGLSVEYRIHRPDGSIRYIHDRGFQAGAGEGGRVVGIAQDITDRKQAEEKLKEANQRLVGASRQAGMAEVATDVLHNVGNVLNSVNVSTSLIAAKMQRSSVVKVGAVARLINENNHNLADFFTQSPKGLVLPRFISQLSQTLEEEQKEVLTEIKSLTKNIEHIKEIVANQQNHAKAAGVTEWLAVSELVDSALEMNVAMLARHKIEVIRHYGKIPNAAMNRHKILQILVNLIVNAKHAMEKLKIPRKFTVEVKMKDADNVQIMMSDNGVGIAEKNITRIFTHGFTTRPHGHGFGLHSGALAAKEMGGSLHAFSDGANMGTRFVLQLPLSGQDTNIIHR